MAMRPCSLCGNTYRGAAQHLYPTVVTEGETYSEHLRLCPADFENLTRRWADGEMQAHEGLFDPAERPVCPFCQGEVPAEDRAQFFCTSYARGDDRMDWWAPVHDSCASPLREDLRLSVRA